MRTNPSNRFTLLKLLEKYGNIAQMNDDAAACLLPDTKGGQRYMSFGLFSLEDGELLEEVKIRNIDYLSVLTTLGDELHKWVPENVEDDEDPNDYDE